MSFSHLFFIYLFLINVWTFLLMRIDKKRSKQRRKRRIRERTLLLLSLVGGGLGTWVAMGIYHHKTKHFSFEMIAPLSTMIWAVLVLYMMYRGLMIS